MQKKETLLSIMKYIFVKIPFCRLVTFITMPGSSAVIPLTLS